jgi:hypothetical protein
MTILGVAGGTAYALYRKPPNGLRTMLTAGGTGTFIDLAYGWFFKCTDKADEWQMIRERIKANKKRE